MRRKLTAVAAILGYSLSDSTILPAKDIARMATLAEADMSLVTRRPRPRWFCVAVLGLAALPAPPAAAQDPLPMKPVIAGFIDFIGDRRIRELRAVWIHAGGNAIALILAIFNAFIHSRDQKNH